MNYDEFAFANQQLAGMIKSGLHLEGALRQLAATMKRGELREELTKLESDLASGKPLVKALGERKLPPLYIRMVAAGVAAGDLPGVLTMMGDHYQQLHLTWTRLKGLMVYPLLVMLAGLGVMALLTWILSSLLANGFSDFVVAGSAGRVIASLWVAPILLALLAVAVGVALATPAIRRELQWRLPGFREANLARLAASAGMLLQRGVPLPESLALLEAMESPGAASIDLGVWRRRLGEGRRNFAEVAHGANCFPPVFVWMVASAGDDISAGFRRAAGMYQARAGYQIELLLYGALPVAILFIGALIVGQISPFMRIMVQFMHSLGNP
jgi:type II secretory pathway component PulF